MSRRRNQRERRRETEPPDPAAEALQGGIMVALNTSGFPKELPAEVEVGGRRYVLRGGEYVPAPEVSA